MFVRRNHKKKGWSSCDTLPSKSLDRLWTAQYRAKVWGKRLQSLKVRGKRMQILKVLGKRMQIKVRLEAYTHCCIERYSIISNTYCSFVFKKMSWPSILLNLWKTGWKISYCSTVRYIFVSTIFALYNKT